MALIKADEEFLVNETYRFIYPILRLYGEDFYNPIRMVFKLGVFIDDIMTERDEEDYLHVVVSPQTTIDRYGKKFYDDAIGRMRADERVEKIYPLATDPSLTVLMIRIPQKYQGCIGELLRGNITCYSKSDIAACFRANCKENEPYFAYCRNMMAVGRHLDVNLSNEVLNF